MAAAESAESPSGANSGSSKLGNTNGTIKLGDAKDDTIKLGSAKDSTIKPGDNKDSTAKLGDGKDGTSNLGDTQLATTQGPSDWKPKMRKPGTRWDGRASSLTLKEYRELKWSKEASMKMALKSGPSWTMRGPMPSRQRSAPVQLETDVCRALDAVKPKAPTFSMGVSIIGGFQERSPGPLYKIPNPMDPWQHPTLHKLTGPRFTGLNTALSEEVTPAPGQYSTENYTASARYKTCPSFTLQGREAWYPSTKPGGPAVGEYETRGMKPNGGAMTSTRWTMMVPREDVIKPSPGPACYNVPGAGARNHFASARLRRPEEWPMSKEPRGLL